MSDNSLTQKVSQVIAPELVDPLESYFFEYENCPWALQQKTPKDPFILIGYFKESDTPALAIQQLRSEFPQIQEAFQTETLKASEWQNAYKSFVKPWSDRSLHWIPLWAKDTYTLPDSAHGVYLDAGMAFGTGSHETTQLCASRLLDYYETIDSDSSRLNIVDAGCGSGILALSASVLGLSSVRGFDNDPDAIKVCQENVSMNPHIPEVSFSLADLNSGLPRAEIDFLMANIQTDILIPFSSQIIKSLRPSAVLVLSGILTKELKGLRAHYEHAFKKLHPNAVLKMDSREKGEWSDLKVEILACDTHKLS